MMKKMVSFVIFLSSFFAPFAFALQESMGPSLGQMATSVLEPVSLFTGLLYDVCYIAGGAFIAGSLIQYKAYRDNPLQVPISRPIMLLIFGLVLVALPFVTQLSSGASAAR